MYKSKEKRKAYIKAWRAKKAAEGHYGLCNNCKPSGQRIADKVKWAKEILERNT